MARSFFSTSALPHQRRPRRALTLLQLVATVSIVGVLSALIIYRVFVPNESARRNACYVLKGQIELQAQLWYRHNGSWPATDLSDIGADTEYFPEGLPTCPVDGSSYSIDAATHRVLGHTH